MNNELKDLILDTIETSLDAQLRAVRRLRKQGPPPAETGRSSRPSQLDTAYHILTKALSPLHISELLARIGSSFGVAADRESLVSSYRKEHLRGESGIGLFSASQVAP